MNRSEFFNEYVLLDLKKIIDHTLDIYEFLTRKFKIIKNDIRDDVLIGEAEVNDLQELLHIIKKTIIFQQSINQGCFSIL